VDKISLILHWATIILLAAILTGCAASEVEQEPLTGMANPASVYSRRKLARMNWDSMEFASFPTGASATPGTS